MNKIQITFHPPQFLRVSCSIIPTKKPDMGNEVDETIDQCSTTAFIRGTNKIYEDDFSMLKPQMKLTTSKQRQIARIFINKARYSSTTIDKSKNKNNLSSFSLIMVLIDF